MKHVVSVSIGSSTRNHRVTERFFGESFLIERIGTDGKIDDAIALIRDMDGKVDAFGMGGIDLYIVNGDHRYTFRDARRIASAAQKTPIVDGSGLKNTLERHVVAQMAEDPKLSPKGKRVLIVSAMDRFGMAEAMVAAGAHCTFGDLPFAIDVPMGLHSLKTLGLLSRIALPIVTQLPFTLVYPTGTAQEQESVPRFQRFYEEAEIIAGDFHYIRKYLPARIDGKTILTNTTTSRDVALLRERGAACLITTTPQWEGRSFGTNVLEALLVASVGQRPETIDPQTYEEWILRLGITPHVERWDREAADA
ncbi:MAG: quinate 5-dehydrogenase [Firmicutes bacterium]|nr:quinate 5-dehydrogenase [Bacillota bacterium]